MQTPRTNVFGTDGNNQAAMGGFNTSSEALTMEMEDGSSTGLGRPVVSIATAAVTPGTPLQVGVTDTAQQLPSTSAREVALKNDDGGDPQGNTATIWVGRSNAVAVGAATDAWPIRVGESMTVPLTGDTDELWVIAAIPGPNALYVWPIQ